MNKKFLISVLILFAIFNLGAFGRPKKYKCRKPIYFFENVKKEDMFTYLDEATSSGGFIVKKFYPELGFLSVEYKVSKNAPEEVFIDVKQFGNDAYMFLDIQKNKTNLEKYIYDYMRKHATSSYSLNDDLFCREFTKDVNSINTTRKPSMQESQYIPSMYVIHMKRYIGFNKKIYWWQKKLYKNDLKHKNGDI